MDSFAGKWIDQFGATITVQETDNVITSLKYTDGAGPFQGFEVDLYAPVISVNFTNDAPYTGVLAGQQILWSNTTVWKRA